MHQAQLAEPCRTCTYKHVSGDDEPCSNCEAGDQRVTTESDPSGLVSGEPGAKMDSGKIRVSLLKRFGLALLAVADLATGGAEKYSAHGWASVDNGIERYDDALFGHYLKEMFQDIDPDMKVREQVSVAWNALARLQLLIEADPEWQQRLLARKATNRYEISVEG
jgi:hypothetical protein